MKILVIQENGRHERIESIESAFLCKEPLFL